MPESTGRPEPGAKRRGRQEQATDVFGDLLPDTTSDESARAWGDRDGSRDDDLLRDVPPHHG
ncbi:hypothetical protein MU582_18335 [Nocardioidaceae bacterium SCSIO 66511]|nr:hypothetical protein MU582_18335 [Nocardioidaceae bacterium SCSIO 66511]